MNNKLSENNFSTQENQELFMMLVKNKQVIALHTLIGRGKHSQHLFCTEQAACLSGHITNTNVTLLYLRRKFMVVVLSE
jgi:putative heme iron utilization protein